MTHIIRVYPHNDLLNLAFYNIEIIRTKVKNLNNESLSLDCMNCLISLAFSVEAIINFVGNMKITNWEEREKHHKKLKQVCEGVNIDFDENIEPFKTLKIIKDIRDNIAHGKPIERQVDIKTKQDLKDAMNQPWDDNCNPEFVENAFQHVNEFETLLLTNWDIDISSTVTSASPKKI